MSDKRLLTITYTFFSVLHDTSSTLMNAKVFKDCIYNVIYLTTGLQCL